MLPPPHYLGIDVSKASLMAAQGGRRWSFSNTAEGHHLLLERIRQLPAPVHAVCEATGGYHLALCRQLQQAGVPVSVVNPARIRHYALSDGLRAKNDPIDAALIERFAQEKR